MFSHQVAKAADYALQVGGLVFAYGSHLVLRDVSFSLMTGEIVTLIGLSGAGKSTLLQVLAGMLKPSGGYISIGSDQVAYMMQQDLLLPWRTVLANVTLVGELGVSARPWSALEEAAEGLLAEVGLKGYEHRYPHELSGGMRQRVSLARSLLLGRSVLLLDEPFMALDVLLREQMYVLLRKIQKLYGTTILMVTHDFRDALSLSDRILHLRGGAIVDDWSVADAVRQDAVAFGMHYAKLRVALES